MKDEYISVEHLFLGILAHPCASLKGIFDKFGVKKTLFKGFVGRQGQR